MAKLIWDNSGIERAAQVLHVINPGRSGNSPENIADYIKSHAESTLHEPGYVGTGGWYVTAFQTDYDPAGTLRALVTIMPYSVECYIKDRTAV